jgi:hypothetical protein
MQRDGELYKHSSSEMHMHSCMCFTVRNNSYLQRLVPLLP